MSKNYNTQSTMKYFLKTISFTALGLTLLASCKKEKDPDFTVIRTDSVFLGTSKTTDTINVLANDTYFNLSSFLLYYSEIASQNADSTIAIQTSATFYGTLPVTYEVTDKNGSKRGTIVVTRGNAEQIKAYNLLRSIKNDRILFLYAIDGDTNGIYQNRNNYSTIYKSNTILIDFPELSESIPPAHVDFYKSILVDGTIYTEDDMDNHAVFYKIQDGFTAQAKTLDGKRVVPVTGYTITYYGHTLDYIYPVPNN